MTKDAMTQQPAVEPAPIPLGGQHGPSVTAKEARELDECLAVEPAPEAVLTEGEALKPCPFCGRRDIEEREQEMSEGPPWVWHVCVDCEAETGGVSGYASARAAWNRRASHTPEQPDSRSGAGEAEDHIAYVEETFRLMIESKKYRGPIASRAVTGGWRMRELRKLLAPAQPQQPDTASVRNLLGPHTLSSWGTREAIMAAVRDTKARYEKARCDSPAVSECARCTAMFLARTLEKLVSLNDQEVASLSLALTAPPADGGAK